MTVKQSLHSGLASSVRRPGSLHRHALLSIVAEHRQPISTTALSEITGQTLGATAHHVRGMASAGLLDWAGEPRARGALQTFYVASESGVEALRRPRAAALAFLFGTPTADDRGWFAAIDELDDTACAALDRLRLDLRPKIRDVVRESVERAEA